MDFFEVDNQSGLLSVKSSLERDPLELYRVTIVGGVNSKYLLVNIQDVRGRLEPVE